MRTDTSAAPHVAPHVAVAGAGFSGTMLAVHLHRLGLRVTLIDRAERFAGGLAYATCSAEHVLNVRAAKMSAFPDAPDHFTRWLAGQGEGNADTFAGRSQYRRYLTDALGQAEGIDRMDGEVAAVDADGVRLASGARLAADAVVVALGNLPPAPIAAFAGTPNYVNDPWHPDGRATIAALAAQDGDVLVVGTGLTMVDTVLSLDAHGFGGRIVAVSRRGLVPRAHAPHAVPAIDPPSARSPRGLLRWARRQAEAHDWRAVVDSLRAETVGIWQSWSVAERGSFLRHARPWWDVRRHRIAPAVTQRLDALIAEGRLAVRAGRIVGVDGPAVTIGLRGERRTQVVRAAGVVNCTGPRGDIRRSANPLLRDLLASGAARTDAFGLGLEIDVDGRLLSTDHQASPLYAVGPMTRGALWEMVAVPDISVQAARLAAVITADLSRAAARTAAAA